MNGTWRLEDAEADAVAAGVEVRLDAEVGGGDSAGEAALHDEAGVVGDADEGRRGAHPELGADEVLPVAHPQHDAAKVGAQVPEQDALVIQVLGVDHRYWGKYLFKLWNTVLGPRLRDFTSSCEANSRNQGKAIRRAM